MVTVMQSQRFFTAGPCIGVLVFLLNAPATSAQESLINEATLRGHVRFLADDLLEGRGPGSRGDKLTQLYLATQFQTLGLAPAAADGGWSQHVPLVGVQTHQPKAVTFRWKDKSVALKSIVDFVSSCGHPTEKISLDAAEVVFVGYGIECLNTNGTTTRGRTWRARSC